MLCIKDLDLNTLVSGVGFNSYSNPHTQKSDNYYPHINLCMDHISQHKMMQSSLLTVYMGIYIIQTRVPVRIYIYTAIVKKIKPFMRKDRILLLHILPPHLPLLVEP